MFSHCKLLLSFAWLESLKVLVKLLRLAHEVKRTCHTNSFNVTPKVYQTFRQYANDFNKKNTTFSVFLQYNDIKFNYLTKLNQKCRLFAILRGLVKMRQHQVRSDLAQVYQ